MGDYEKLGLFYLGKRYDLARQARLSEPVLYDSRDLLTHAMCVGMTGSGKTGLGITVIEEAAIDGVPVLAIDPKGDLANLLLTFPALTASDFRPWVDTTQAGSSSPDTVAAEAALAWTKGLAEWDQDAARIGRLKAAAEVRVYTPGSRAATPLALLKSFAAPANENEEDAASRVSTTARSLLALAGIADQSATPSRELTLLSTILMQAERIGTAVDLAWLIQQIQRPGIDRIGVLDLETFYPARERQELALKFNSVFATPGFEIWLQGEPLDIGNILFTPDGRPRVAIISIAHLGDAERMLVVSLVVNAMLEWTRRQSGTGSLRALFYMDEVFGYLPPVANPPSKLPLLTLLKQARAFGVGLMLATQNPVDLDYKALSNIGTWFLGKLQTERDKARVLDGIESIDGGTDRRTLDNTLSTLRGRLFFMHNVHEREPIIFETRWTLSYLRGPMGRDELRRAMALAAPSAGTGADRSAADHAQPAAPPPIPAQQSGATSHAQAALSRPVLPAGIREFFIPGAGATATADYVPVLYGAARVQYADTKRGVDTIADVTMVTPFATGALPVDWNAAKSVDVTPDRLLPEPPSSSPAVRFQPVPSIALNPRSYAGWSRDFAQWLAQSRPLRLYQVPSLKLTSRADENERDFRLRVQQLLRETRDAGVDALRAKYAPKLARAADKLAKAQDALTREGQQVEQQKMQTVVSVGATLLGAFMGRKAFTASTLGRATTAARSVSRSMKEAQDVSRAQEKVTQVAEEQRELQAELDAEIATLSAGDAAQGALDTIDIKPKKTAIDVQLVTLAWKSGEK